MESKKSDSKNLERYKALFFQSGLVVALFVVLAAFEWKTGESNSNEIVEPSYIPDDTEMAAITKPDKAQVKPLTSTTLLDIRPDDVLIVDTFDLSFDTPDVILNPKDFIPKHEDDPVIDEPPVMIAPEMPEFPGGEAALYAYLGKNIRYPELARSIDLQGIVFITFVIEKDGNVSNSAVLHGIGGGCDEEALRVINAMPNWKPGKNSLGRPIRVQMNLPVKFILIN